MAGESIGNYSVVDTATVGVVVVTNNKSSIANTFQPVLAPDVRILLDVEYAPTVQEA